MDHTGGSVGFDEKRPIDPVDNASSVAKTNPAISQTTATWRQQIQHHPGDPHSQFCQIIGIRDTPPKKGDKDYRSWSKTLYARLYNRYRAQRNEYLRIAFISNSLLLLQIFIGAILTALGASASPHIVIAVFGAINTVIAGVITYLKGRGQPMRARAFRDELERCLDEIDDAQAAFLGVSKGMWGYELETDSDKQISQAESDEFWRKSVREEMERLTALYEAAQENARRNAPDMWVRASDGQPRAKTGIGARKLATTKEVTLTQDFKGAGDGGAGGENVTPKTVIPGDHNV